MKEITITTVDELFKALKEYNIIYNEDYSVKYWLYQGFIMSVDVDDDNATPVINDKIIFNQKFHFMEK